MAWTNPTTRSTGTLITASIWNVDLVDNLTYLKSGRFRCGAVRSGVQSITSATWTSVALNGTDIFDVGTMHDPVTNNTRLTVPSTGAGDYLLGGFADFAPSAGGTVRGVRFRKNGTTAQQYEGRAYPFASGVSLVYIWMIVTLANSDYVEMQVYQDSGGALDTNSSFTDVAYALQVG